MRVTRSSTKRARSPTPADSRRVDARITDAAGRSALVLRDAAVETVANECAVTLAHRDKSTGLEDLAGIILALLLSQLSVLATVPLLLNACISASSAFGIVIFVARKLAAVRLLRWLSAT